MNQHPEIWHWFSYTGDYTRVEFLPPALLNPTQRTVNPKLVQYYRLRGHEKNSDGGLPLALLLDGEYWLLDGHHRWTALMNRPRIRVRVYEVLPFAA